MLNVQELREFVAQTHADFVLLHTRQSSVAAVCARYGEALRRAPLADVADDALLARLLQIEGALQLAEAFLLPLPLAGSFSVTSSSRRVRVWLGAHDPALAATADAVDSLLLDVGAGPARRDVHPALWRLLQRSLCNGDVARARALLAKVPRGKGGLAAKVHGALDELLRRMPTLTVGDSEEEEDPAGFRDAWSEWHALCCAVSESQQLNERVPEEARATFRILSGDTAALLAAVTAEEDGSSSAHWEELLLAVLLFADPLAPREAVGEFATLCTRQTGEDAEGALPWNRLLPLRLVQRDVDAAIRIAEENLPSWFAAHLADLLCYDTPLPRRDALVLAYARELLDHPAFWEFALDYAATCETGEAARPIFDAAVATVPVENDVVARKLVSACRRCAAMAPGSVAEVALEACDAAHRRVGLNRLDDGLWGDAMAWLVRTNDAKLVAGIATRLLAKHLESVDDRTVSQIDAVVSAVESAPAVAGQIAFLASYRDVLRLRELGQLPQYARKLVDTLRHPQTPRMLRVKLLKDALPLLSQSSGRPLFGQEDTCELIAILEDLSSGKGTASLQADQRQQIEIRLALSNNLARAMMAGPSPI